MPVKYILLLSLFLPFCISARAQKKETFDVVSYIVPGGWNKQVVDGGIQLYVTDKKTGGYAIAIVTKSMASTGSANGDFKSQWKSLLINTVSSLTVPDMEAPVQDDGWEILSGNGHYVDQNTKGLATLITATGYQQTAAVVLMTNTQQYQNALLGFINSLSLTKREQPETTPVPTSADDRHVSSIVGLWTHYTTESSGTYNGFPQLTGGYFRSEYAFYADGTYLFRVKNWSMYAKEIQYVFESGTWLMKGDQLVINPKQGKGDWWKKSASNKTNEWGNLARTGSWKLEPVTYTVDFHFYAGSNETHLLLKSDAETAREGRQENNTITYAPRASDKSLIDNPPGFKTGFENKSLTQGSDQKK